MALRFRKNQYQGVNAHLHSRLQNIPEGWLEFHGQHIVDLSRAISEILPSGYLVSTEKSAQIRGVHPDTGEVIRFKKKPRPDITIYDLNPRAKTRSHNPGIVAAPTLTFPPPETIEDMEIYLNAITIRPIEDDDIGEPVTWLELLSPTNKPAQGGYIQYAEKRLLTLKFSIVLVEIDYLHQTPPITKRIPNYPDREAGAYPYNIMVSDLHPSLELGESSMYGFAVNDPIPTINIPLAGSDSINLDFNAAYQQTFESLPAFSYRVDYQRDPERFDTYHPADQKRIRNVMTAAHTQPA